MGILTRLVLRRAGWVVAVASALAGVSLYYSVQLFMNLRTQIEELLPTTARSVQDLDEVVRRLEAIENLSVVVESDDAAGARRFIEDFAARLSKLPPDEIASVEYQIARELRFFSARKSLYMEVGDLVLIRDYIRDRIEYERSLYNPLTIFSELQLPEPVLDFDGMRLKYEKRGSAYTRFPDGHYATPDGRKRVMLVYQPSKAAGGNEFKVRRAVDRELAKVDFSKYPDDLTLKFTGGTQMAIDEQTALVEDLELSTVVVIVAVTLAMQLFFRATRAVFALITALFFGTFWTFGASFFAVGYLNANTAFLGSIVIGNGINFPIILLARYLEERRRGTGHPRALKIAMQGTATATFTAALAAGLSYGSLVLTGFRGFNQFGVIGLIGMVLCWLAAYTVLPALLTVLDARRPIARRSPPTGFGVAGAAAGFVARHPRLLWSFSFLVTVLSLASFTRYSPDIIETNLAKLRNKASMERGAGFHSLIVDEIFGRYLTPLVVLPRNRSDTPLIAAKLREQQARDGRHSLIAAVQTLEDFVPPEQPRKIKLLHEIRRLLPRRLQARLSLEDRALVGQLLDPATLQPFGTKDLPPLVIRKFTERDGTIGKMVLVEPPVTNDTIFGDKLIKFVRQLREAADSVAPGTPVAGNMPITGDMIHSVNTDGPRATLFAFVAVTLLVLFLFRNLRISGLVLFALLLGVTWLGGFILGFGSKINFLNFIALPITFGIGVDYGVNIFQRYRQEGSTSILRVIRETGGAVALCSFTTVVGYGSLLLAQNQAFVSFGLLAVVGELTCLFAALFSLPAFLLLQARKREKTGVTGT